MAYFPLFINLKNKPCLVVGGGKVALRKILTLLDFEAKITVICKDSLPEINELYKNSRINLLLREYNKYDLTGIFLAVAATDDRKTNHMIYEAALSGNIPVNVADSLAESTFIFPAYVKEKDLVAAFCGSGKSPACSKYLKEKVKEILTPFLGSLNDCMGELRKKIVPSDIPMEKRNKYYSDIVENAINNNRLPNIKE